MKVLVIGSGAREDALSWRLALSPSCSAVYAAPGNAGTASRGENWSLSATDGKAIVEKCRKEKVDLVVLGPETAIAAGVGDQLRNARIATFGPSRSAGRLESSKAFSKRFMQRNGIPTAPAVIVRSLASARKALDDWAGPCVVKADGLASGKGVVVTPSSDVAQAVLTDWFTGNTIPGGGTDVLLEEKLEGREISVFALSDGSGMVPFGAACDYKRAGDKDTGPNTGGMGAYSPPIGFPSDLYDEVRDRILEPAARGLRAQNERYVGVLYCGLMWTAAGPKVIEFNARFGDPETQVLLPRLRGDFALLLKSAADGALDPSLVSFSDEACVAVVIAGAGYPKSNMPLTGLPPVLSLPERAHAFWGNSELRGGEIHSAGGRVVTISALGNSAVAARSAAYEAVRAVAEQMGAGNDLTYRTDIALGCALSNFSS